MISVSVFLYSWNIIINYNPEKNTHYYSGGQYVINTLFSVDKTFYWTVFGLPVYLNVKGEITLQFDGRYTTDEEEITAQEMGYYENLADKVKTEWPYVQVGFGATLQPGIGLCGILGARGMFKFAFVGRFNTDVHDFGAKGGSMGTFTGGVAVDLALISFEYELGSADFWSPTGCFKKENKSARQSSASSSAKSSSEENISLRAFDNGEEYRSMMLRSTFVHLFPVQRQHSSTEQWNMSAHSLSNLVTDAQCSCSSEI